MPAFSLKVPRLAAAFAVLGFASCGTARFYSQAVRGQIEILHRAQPVAEVKAAPRTTDKLRRQLDLVGELREFARTELHLPVKKQFSTYADLGRPYAVFCVYAAPEFSVEAKSWWYPFIGRAKYRGFFNENLARQEVATLKREGSDVFLGGVRVYSTLGWFADPVLNTFIADDPAQLAETIFHELTHSRVFLGGDSDFNEAFATANAEEGVRRWLRAKGDGKTLARYEQSLGSGTAVLALLKRAREKLRALYGRDALADSDKRAAKARTFDEVRREYHELKARGGADAGRDAWFGGQFNNARLASIATYHDLVPGFTAMLGRYGGDLEKFYHAVEDMKKIDKDERRRRLLNGG